MAKPFDFGEIRLRTDDADTSGAQANVEGAFQIVVLGDFSGRASRRVCEPGSIAKRRGILVDRDNFDEVLAQFGVELHLPMDNPNDALRLRFDELDDFHPDRIFERSEMFRRLREMRASLSDPATFAKAAQELGLVSEGQPAAPPKPAESPAVAPSAVRLASGSLLEASIEETEGLTSQAGPSRAPDELREFARRVAEPHLAPAANPRQAEVVAVLDRAIGAQMRALMHTAAFQALEAAWRGIFFLVRRVETTSQLKLFVVDISKAEVAADFGASEDPRSTGLYRLLVEGTVGTPGADRWAVIVGNYTFGPSRRDSELLGRMAKIARAAGAPFVAGASPRILGCASLTATPQPREWKQPPNAEDAAAWAAARRLPEADALGLALPRFLLRMPYGKKTDAVESFAFEEMEDAPAHEDYLWCNPAIACATLLAQSFSQDGWEMRPGVIAEIDGLPLHVYEQNGESVLKPCAEALLTIEAAERILDCGLMPLVSLKGRDAVRLARFQSIADPPRALVGPWSR